MMKAYVEFHQGSWRRVIW